MKKIIILILSFFAVNISMAQSSPNCDSATMDTKAEIRDAEPCAEIAADYILSKSLKTQNKKYTSYQQFLTTWMDKTDRYTFTLNAKMVAVCDDNASTLLLGVYMACLAKAAITLKKDFYEEAIKLFVTYVSEADKRVYQSPKIKKLISDYNANKLDKYIK